MPNRLAHETSPYLLQHADNPVDWYPWGEEALRAARDQGKPILLSVGYAACHWCHVMAHESFEDPATAAQMNRQFINVKVDREERPDLDDIYMQAVQAMTGQGGWPMTVFLTPDGVPFFAGAYFPPEERHGLPAFVAVLDAVVEAYQTRPDEIARNAQQMVRALRPTSPSAPSGQPPELLLQEAVQRLEGRFDQAHGGFDGPPKFPQAPVLAFLLREHIRQGEPRSLAMVETTLQAMARGGLYDQVGGGFHRYVVDRAWVVPHFEKMLY
ncbi:MAG: thioredoxin domain-containing protein, partial [Chloroflexi bacterium]|nr:thioredoxin domain-containing protein [Chloroflexota bacterium]